MELLINRCWGGFGVSAMTLMHTAERKGIKVFPYTEKFDFDDGNVANGWHLNQIYTRITEMPIEEPSGVSEIVVFLQKDPGQEVVTPDNIENFNQWDFSPDNNRTDKDLIASVKEDGEGANAQCSEPHVVTIPEGFDYKIDDYDGMESVYVGRDLHMVTGEENE